MSESFLPAQPLDCSSHSTSPS